MNHRLVLIGPGRVGSAVARAARDAGWEVAEVRRGEAVPATPRGTPIVVATRADALDELLGRLSAAAHDDLVFLQNGMILPVLRAHGVEGATLGMVYFAATRREGPVDAGAPTLLHGPHAEVLAGLLAAHGIPARTLDDRTERLREFATKLSWNLVFGLLGDRWDEPVGASAARTDEIRMLVAELAPVLAHATGVPVPVEPTVDRLLAYSRAIPDFRAGVRELTWRNGWAADAAAAHGFPTPTHDALLRALGHR